jgi:hypothetical protein
MPAPMPRQKSDLASIQFAQDKSVRRIAKGRLHAFFLYVGKSRHRVQPAAANDANLCLSQSPLLPTSSQLNRADFRPAALTVANTLV